MKIAYALSIRQIIAIILIFTFAIMAFLVAGDMVVIPAINEMARDISVRNWCGFLAKCTDGARPSLVEYIYSGEFWRNSIDFGVFWVRLIKSAVIGLLFGVGWALVIMFKR
ncbi:hypothetical protein [Cupriavidus pampae]|uniref:hypothetical protein n=1 Tax=Cupriavidus pampae TaxID=659251 RepID=UPI001CC72EFF|nr:hypothetical protein [Cupriavidus pampae]